VNEQESCDKLGDSLGTGGGGEKKKKKKNILREKRNRGGGGRAIIKLGAVENQRKSTSIEGKKSNTERKALQKIKEG